MMNSIDLINAALRGKEVSKEENLKKVKAQIKKHQDVKAANETTVLGINVNDAVAGIVSKDQLTLKKGGQSTAGQLVDASKSKFTPTFSLIDVDHTGAMRAPDSDGSGNYDPVDSDGTANASQPDPASKDSKAGFALGTDLTGVIPPEESIDIVALGGAAVDSLTTAIGISTDRKLSLIEEIAEVANATTAQPGGLPSSFNEQIRAMKDKIKYPFADENTLDYFQKSWLYNSRGAQQDTSPNYDIPTHPVHRWRLPKANGHRNHLLLHILPSNKLDKKCLARMDVWNNMPGLQSWNGQYFQCWLSEFPAVNLYKPRSLKVLQSVEGNCYGSPETRTHSLGHGLMMMSILQGQWKKVVDSLKNNMTQVFLRNN